MRVVMRLDDDEFWRGPTTCDDRVWYAPAVRAFVRAVKALRAHPEVTS